MPQILHQMPSEPHERVRPTSDTLELLSGIPLRPDAKLCVECGGVFATENPRRIYCCNACRQKAYRRRHHPDNLDKVITSFTEWMSLPWYKRLWYWITDSPRFEP